MALDPSACKRGIGRIPTHRANLLEYGRERVATLRPWGGLPSSLREGDNREGDGRGWQEKREPPAKAKASHQVRPPC